MYAQFGNYDFPENAVMVGIRRSVNDPKNPTEETLEVDLSGTLLASGQSACASAQAALLAACRQTEETFTFFTDAGASAIKLSSSNALSGPNVSRGPDFGGQNGGYEFVAGRSFSLTITATYPMSTQPVHSGLQLLSWSESISRQGDGKARYGHMETMNTRAQRVMLKAFSLYRATQSGSASALLGYPVPPGPIWSPGLYASDPEVTYTSPQTQGDPFQISWAYSFESTAPLLGLPSFGWR